MVRCGEHEHSYQDRLHHHSHGSPPGRDAPHKGSQGKKEISFLVLKLHFQVVHSH